ncbi:integrase, catalytic region, zinc finger, CCHC-type containing protein [Tanacetum coccineum]
MVSGMLNWAEYTTVKSGNMMERLVQEENRYSHHRQFFGDQLAHNLFRYPVTWLHNKGMETQRPGSICVEDQVRVLHSEREQFEKQEGWTIKKMTPADKDEYNLDELEPSPIQQEYAPVIFAQDTIAHVISLDMLTGKEDRENVMRVRELGKGVLTSLKELKQLTGILVESLISNRWLRSYFNNLQPLRSLDEVPCWGHRLKYPVRELGKGVLTSLFELIKTNRLGVILTFAMYKRDLPSNATLEKELMQLIGILVESLISNRWLRSYFNNLQPLRSLDEVPCWGHRLKTVRVNGINMHVAEKGEGPIVLFLHDFPELWYTWRHQILALADLGYHAVAPDLRGYGDTDAPLSATSYTCFHIVGDVVGLIDSLGVDQEPGVMEAELKSYEVEHVLRSILTITEPGPVRLPMSEPFGSKSSYVSPPLPPWLSEEDIKYNVQKFEQGFTEALNYYRALDLNWELTAPWTGIQIKVPVIYVIGEKDPVYTTPGAKTYIHSGMFKKDVPLLQQVVNGVNILKSIDEGPFQMGTFRETLAEGTEGALGPERPRVYSDLSPEDKERYNADIRAMNILLQGLPKDIYSLINHYTDAKDIWDNVKMLLEGSELTKEDHESQLYDDFEHFCQHKGETNHDYYVRFAKLINDMLNIKMTMSRMQLNSKFVNNMLPEWGRFVTAVKLNRGLRDSNYDQLYAYLKQHEAHANENKMLLDRFTQHTVDPLALISNVAPQQYNSQSSTNPSSTYVPLLLAHQLGTLSPPPLFIVYQIDFGQQ